MKYNRFRNWPRRLKLGSVILLTCATTASCAAPSTSPSPSRHIQAVDADSKSADVAWTVTASDLRQDDTLWIRHGSSSPVPVGTFSKVEQVATQHAAGLLLEGFSTAKGRTYTVLERNSTVGMEPISAALSPVLTLTGSSLLTQQDTNIVSDPRPSTKTQALPPDPMIKYHLAGLVPDAKPVRSTKVLAFGQILAEGLVTTATADTVAFLSDGSSGYVANLSTGAPARQLPYSDFSQAILSGGAIVAAAWNTSVGDVHMISINPDDLSSTTDVDTHVSVHSLLTVSLLDLAGASTVATVFKNPAADTVTADAVVMPDNRAPSRIHVVSLPTDVGRLTAPAGGRKMFIFGGPGHNHVSELDTASGAVFARQDLDAPAGSYVVGVQAT